MRVFGHALILLIAAILLAPLPAAAQAAQRGRLTITVADPSGAVIPNATVTLVPLDPAAKAATLPPAKTTDKGFVTFDDLAMGRYSVRAEFPGFKMGLLRDFRVNRGDTLDLVSVAGVEVHFGAIRALDHVAVGDDSIEGDEEAAAA